jgi:hypothetical protein
VDRAEVLFVVRSCEVRYELRAVLQAGLVVVSLFCLDYTTAAVCLSGDDWGRVWLLL